MLSEISAEIENMPESEVDKDLSLMNLVLENGVCPPLKWLTFCPPELNMEPVDLESGPCRGNYFSCFCRVGPKIRSFSYFRQWNGNRNRFGNPLDEDGFDNLTHLLGKTINPKVAYRGQVHRQLMKLTDRRKIGRLMSSSMIWVIRGSR